MNGQILFLFLIIHVMQIFQKCHHRWMDLWQSSVTVVRIRGFSSFPLRCPMLITLLVTLLLFHGRNLYKISKKFESSPSIYTSLH